MLALKNLHCTIRVVVSSRCVLSCRYIEVVHKQPDIPPALYPYIYVYTPISINTVGWLLSRVRARRGWRVIGMNEGTMACVVVM